MTRFIKLPLKLRKELQKRFNVTRVAVNDALSFRFNSKRSNEIREAALAAGGEIVETAMCPQCSTEHTQDAIIQTFENGVVLVISKRDSSAEIKKEDKLILRYLSVKMADWDELIRRASFFAGRR